VIEKVEYDLLFIPCKAEALFAISSVEYFS
jgi:hypothetical protein